MLIDVSRVCYDDSNESNMNKYVYERYEVIDEMTSECMIYSIDEMLMK